VFFFFLPFRPFTWTRRDQQDEREERKEKRETPIYLLVCVCPSARRSTRSSSSNPLSRGDALLHVSPIVSEKLGASRRRLLCQSGSGEGVLLIQTSTIALFFDRPSKKKPALEDFRIFLNISFLFYSATAPRFLLLLLLLLLFFAERENSIASLL